MREASPSPHGGRRDLMDPATTYVEPRRVWGAYVSTPHGAAGQTVVGKDASRPHTSFGYPVATIAGCSLVLEGDFLESMESAVCHWAGGHLARGHMGNFGEVKNATCPGTKVGHFSDIGDRSVPGKHAAGTIT